MRSTSRAWLVGFGILVVATGSAHRAWGAAGIDAAVLADPALENLHRFGLVVVGGEGREARAAAAIVARDLRGVGREVVRLPAAAAGLPVTALAANYCARSDLDAVAFVRMWTVAGGWRADVDLRDRRGKALLLTRVRGEFAGAYEVASYSLVPRGVSFTITPEEVVAYEGRDEAAAERAPRLRMVVEPNRTVRLGVVNLTGPEFYEAVGRPDLAADYRRRSDLRLAGQVLGWGAVVAAGAAAIVVGGIQIVSPEGQKPALFLIPAALGAAGAVAIVGTYNMERDPVSVDEQRELARAYNARLRVSAALAPNGTGGTLVVGGRF